MADLVIKGSASQRHAELPDVVVAFLQVPAWPIDGEEHVAILTRQLDPEFPFGPCRKLVATGFGACRYGPDQGLRGIPLEHDLADVCTSGRLQADVVSLRLDRKSYQGNDS